MTPKVEVWCSLPGFTRGSAQEAEVGTAFFALRRGELSTTFQYAPSYLENPSSYALQPSLPLRSNAFHVSGLPGAFRDSAPDRWGRRIVLKEHIAAAQSKSVALGTLDEVDYLLGVSDLTREGALRFKVPGNDAFLSVGNSVPPLVDLPRLLGASRDVERGTAGHEELKALLDAGSGSLGGARPKASVLDGSNLLIAKFTHQGDEWDVMAWEKTMLDLAETCGISVPNRRLVRIGAEDCLLVSRFDRAGGRVDGARIPYLSAMSLLGLRDGETSDYAELGDALVGLVTHPSDELRKLFKRVVFSIAVHNADDHLRNSGFVRADGSWALSPLFDVNPEPSLQRERVTGVFGETGAQEAQGAKELAAAFGIAGEEARSIVGETLSGLSKWRAVARRNGCSDAEAGLFAPVFEDRFAALRRAFGLGGE